MNWRRYVNLSATPPHRCGHDNTKLPVVLICARYCSTLHVSLFTATAMWCSHHHRRRGTLICGAVRATRR
jgi:hypothetical protein